MPVHFLRVVWPPSERTISIPARMFGIVFFCVQLPSGSASVRLMRDRFHNGRWLKEVPSHPLMESLCCIGDLVVDVIP